MKELIVSNGGKNSGSISGKTSYLLAGEKAGPEKLKKAENLGVQVIDEATFMQMIGDADKHQAETNSEPEIFASEEVEPQKDDKQSKGANNIEEQQLTLF